MKCQWAVLPVALLIVACTPEPSPPPYFVNSTHPGYGPKEYAADFDRCRTQSLQTLVILTDSPHSLTQVDEKSTAGCMARHGWEQIYNPYATSFAPPRM